MSKNDYQQAKKTARVRRLFTAALMLGCALGTVPNAAAQKIASPKTPDNITPVGTTASLEAQATGTQGYTCLPTSDGGTAWNPTPARKPRYLWISSESRCRSLLTSS